MLEPQEIITIDGPIAEVGRSDATAVFSQGIIYSVQLANGLIVTSPERFPATPPPVRCFEDEGPALK